MTEVTLATGASSTLELIWDTRGASGGPAPPGPPTPGTIHTLTATVILEGDSDSSNDSLSLQPGIWIIAAPAAPTITYPETTQAPQVDYGADLMLSEPAILTSPKPLSASYTSVVESDGRGTLANPTLDTEAQPLARPFNSNVAARSDTSVSEPGISTVKRVLSQVFRSSISAESEAVLANPGISTVVVELSRILFDQVGASSERFLSLPAITTKAQPLTEVLADPTAVRSMSGLEVVTVGTLPEPLTTTYASLTASRVEATLDRPGIYTEAEPLTRILADFYDARTEIEGSRPSIFTRAIPATKFFISPVAGKSYSHLVASAIATIKEPLSSIYPGPVHASFGAGGPQPLLSTEAYSLSEVFVGGGAITYRPAKPMENPLERAEVRGKVSLQRTTSSLGVYVQVGDEVTFVSRDGHFLAAAPAGPFDLLISAPGHLPVIYSGISLGPGQTLLLPPVTLLFGDGDGDNLVDILDLSIAARNYGETIRNLDAP